MRAGCCSLVGRSFRKANQLTVVGGSLSLIPPVELNPAGTARLLQDDPRIGCVARLDTVRCGNLARLSCSSSSTEHLSVH
jgi:hypothetical protein